MTRKAMVVVGTALAAPFALVTAWAGASTAPGAAQARAIANKINLSRSDLPGWKSSPNVASAGDKATSARMAVCAGAQDPSKIDVVDISSPYFDKGGLEVSSNVTVVGTRAEALHDLSAMTGGKLVSCAEKIVVPYLKKAAGPGVTFSGVSIMFLHPTWMSPSSFSYRIRLVINVKGTGGATSSVGLVDDSFGFLVGRTEVEADVSQQVAGKAMVAPGDALEKSVVSLLEGRAAKFAI